MRIYLGIILSLFFFVSDSYANEYFFKKISSKNSTPESIGNLTLSESKNIALQEAMLHSKIILDRGVLSIPGICKVNMRSDLPKKRGQSDLDSIHHVRESAGDNGEYKGVQDDEIDFITRSEPLLDGGSECEFLYRFAIKIGSDLIFYNNGWNVIYTSNSNSKGLQEPIYDKEKYKIGDIICTIIRDNDGDYERNDRCIYNGSLDSAYQQFYVHSLNDGSGWGSLLPSYKDVISHFRSKKNNKFTITPSKNNNKSGEMSIAYTMPTKNSIQLLSSMEGGETQVYFEENSGLTKIEINSSPD
ncbi:hypothetical protein [Aeromonas schubertii]|uniref:hypothetical protein n=1 Tax=Aeromonas schubertii TaxID=652 RepID=UPI000B247F21|nr:hypothetical protein [Aeromonas schubertii]